MNNLLWIGIDIGSTTVKAVVIHSKTKELLYHKYQRHNAKQAETLKLLLEEIREKFQGCTFKAAVCGSGGKPIADYLNIHYIQEVVANSIAIQEYHDNVRVAIELGGQDAKIIFFYFEPTTKKLIASDMRMNGSCAGGTGAFIDEIASLLKVHIDEFNVLASKGTHVYDISGRCGVFAKTDIQPLLNQGVSKEDIALSTFHAIAKQTIGGLAQGLEIKPPVIFEGGPLTFNSKLIDVFKERLHLTDKEIIKPEYPQVIVAMGTALAIDVMFKDEEIYFDINSSIEKLSNYKPAKNTSRLAKKFFETEEEKVEFYKRHKLPEQKYKVYPEGSKIDVYIGIDAGSTTTKFAIIDENEDIIDTFYTHNVGEPLNVLKKGLKDLYNKYKEKNITLNIKGVGTTGYGEFLFAKAFNADYHTVETVAHATAAMKYLEDVSFILDIGGQDMKAIQISNGIVTGITLNEACSAGCGSFLENFANSLNIPVEKIAEMAFKSEAPSILGSRCTVFMNSSIITEQKNGKTPEDIMAGLCRSIIENVFTKVVRINNFSVLGKSMIVQGGTFRNDAVLRAIEQYTGINIVRAPYPGEMGAIGIALLTKKYVKEKGSDYKSTFIGFDALDSFTFTKESNSICPFCTNNCNRTIIRFSSGASFVIGNRCEKGEIIGDLKDETTREKIKKVIEKQETVPDLYKYRIELIFGDYEYKQLIEKQNKKIGIPVVLEFWNSLPFWKTFFKSLGFDVVLSDNSNKKLYEAGLPFVPSDTACFPAKLAHGHVKNLIDKKVDYIFMPIMGRMFAENKRVTSDFTCSVLKGYPMIIKYSDEPEERHNIPFLTPYFPWFDERCKVLQICDFMKNTFNIDKYITKQAIKYADKAMQTMQKKLESKGMEVLKYLEDHDTFGVVLGGRPYHNDPLINHNLSSYFTRHGIPVLTIDSLPDIHNIDVDKVRMDSVVNFHVRMIAGALFTARNSRLEFVQIVSFGCGHDAILTDEIIDIMNKISGKYPLVIKMDESDVVGPINVRVKSFIETIITKRKKFINQEVRPLPEPFPVRYDKKRDKEKIILIPNATESFCKLVSAVLTGMGFRAEPLPIIDEEGIKLAKKYTHNDVCYPAQINIGEFLSVMAKGKYKPEDVVLGLGKITCDCRLSHYPVIARKSLDDAGYKDVPIITTAKDEKLHPGANLGPEFEYKMVWGITMFDILEALVRRMRPYELKKGEVDEVFNKCVDNICSAFKKGVKPAIAAFSKAIDEFCKIQIDDSIRKPRVFIIGEYLLNFHPASNNYIERYLESHGMEVMLPYMIDAFRKDYVRRKGERRLYYVRYPILDTWLNDISDIVVQNALDKLGKIASKCKYYHRKHTLYEMAPKSDHIVHHTYTSGEGWLIPGEIIDHAEEGVNSFVIVQPFGCLPNHITGRGMIKRIKKEFPHIQILSLDYDPDTSIANIENRLQMLIINARELEKLNNKQKRIS